MRVRDLACCNAPPNSYIMFLRCIWVCCEVSVWIAWIASVKLLRDKATRSIRPKLHTDPFFAIVTDFSSNPFIHLLLLVLKVSVWHFFGEQTMLLLKFATFAGERHSSSLHLFTCGCLKHHSNPQSCSFPLNVYTMHYFLRNFEEIAYWWLSLYHSAEVLVWKVSLVQPAAE